MDKQKPASKFWENLWNAFRDSWDVFFAFGSAIVSAFNIGHQWLSQGYIKSDWVLPVELLLFLIFGSIAIIRAKIQQRKAQKELQELKNEYDKFKAEQISINPIAKDGSTALGLRDNFGNILLTPESSSKKLEDDNLQIRIKSIQIHLLNTGGEI